MKDSCDCRDGSPPRKIEFTNLDDEGAILAHGTAKYMGVTVTNLVLRFRAMTMTLNPEYRVVRSVAGNFCTNEVVLHREAGYSFRNGYRAANLNCYAPGRILDDPRPETLILTAPMVWPSLLNKTYVQQQGELGRMEREFGLPQGSLTLGSFHDLATVVWANLWGLSRIVLGSEIEFRSQFCPHAGICVKFCSCSPYIGEGSDDGAAYPNVGGIPMISIPL